MRISCNTNNNPPIRTCRT